MLKVLLIMLLLAAMVLVWGLVDVFHALQRIEFLLGGGCQQ